MRDDYKNKMASKIAARYQDLEERIMQDIVRRIVKTGEITSTADWQINRLRILGHSSEIRMYMSRSMQNIYRMIRTSSLSGSQKQLLTRVVKIWRM